MTMRHAILVLIATGLWCLAGAVAYGALWPADQLQWLSRLAVVMFAAVGGGCLATALNVDTVMRNHERRAGEDDRDVGLTEPVRRP